MSDEGKNTLDSLGEFFIQRLMDVLGDEGVTPADLEIARKFLKDSNWSLVSEELARDTSLGKRLQQSVRNAGGHPALDLGEMPFE